ncbi:MAG: hypothetical protein R2878_01435 [Thermoleophilia bacterium]
MTLGAGEGTSGGRAPDDPGLLLSGTDSRRRFDADGSLWILSFVPTKAERAELMDQARWERRTGRGGWPSGMALAPVAVPYTRRRRGSARG